MNFMQRVRLALSPQNAIYEVLQQYANDYLKGDDAPTASKSISAAQAMKFSAVFACNRVLAETLASCSIFLYEKDEKGNRQTVRDSPLNTMLQYSPNPDMTPTAFKECGASNINLGGNFYSQKIFNSSGELIQLRPIEWHRVTMDRNKNTGELLYYVDQGTEPLTRKKILHIPGLTIDGYTGITPIDYARNALSIGLNQDEFTKNFYENGVMSSGAFEYPEELGDDAFNRLKRELKSNYAGLKNAGIPMILEGGGKFKEFTMKLSDAQFIESKRFSIEDICRIFRVPQHLVQMLERSTNNNIEHQSLEFVMYTMLPMFKRWEENLNLQLLTIEDMKKGRYFEFKVDSLLRGDATARATAYATGRLNGWLSINDIRKLENMNPVANGDEYIQPLNYINIKLADEYYSSETQKKNTETKNKIAEEIANMLKSQG